jgi:hypothetical protein
MNPGLDTDQDWLLIQQQAGSGSGFSKIPGSVTGSSEYGSETLEGTGTNQMTTVVTKNRKGNENCGNETQNHFFSYME